MKNSGKFRALRASLCLALAAMPLSACGYKTISYGTEITQNDAAKIELGKTRKDQIYVMFGEPTKVIENTFFYTWTRGSKGSFMGLGSGDATANSLVIVFDNLGIVKDYRLARGAVQSGQID